MKFTVKAHKKLLILTLCFLSLSACSFENSKSAPSIKIVKIPPYDKGGRGALSDIAGEVTGTTAAGRKIILYARSGNAWWIQPFVKNPFTKIQPDSSWKNSVHLGTEYAAVLVEDGYMPLPKISDLPPLGNGVIAVSSVSGTPNNLAAPTPAPKTIKFSGYEWTASNRKSNPGGTQNTFDPSNVSVDEKGYLHLRIIKKDGEWTAAQVGLTRSLGYGTYKIVMRDVSRMEAASAFSMLTWDSQDEDQYHREMNLDVSRWGDPDNKNLQYVVQPYYVPANVVRFDIPTGTTTHTLRWEPEKAAFKSVQINKSNGKTLPIAEYTFASGIPTPKAEIFSLSLFVFGYSKIPLQKETEVVIEKFEYLP